MKKIMKKTIIQLLAIVLLITACNQKKDAPKTAETPVVKTEPVKEKETSAVPDGPLVINESEWVETDLSTTSADIPIIMKLPKNVKLTKDAIGIKAAINSEYIIDIQKSGASAAGDLLAYDKKMEMNAEIYTDAKILQVSDNGFVYKHTTKGGRSQFANSMTHFKIAVRVGEYECIKIKDAQPKGDTKFVYTDELAKQVYSIISKSIKLKK